MNSSLPQTSGGIRHVEVMLVVLLRVCVWLSLAVMAFGMVVSFIHHPYYLSSADPLAYLKGNDRTFIASIGELITGLRDFRGQSIVVLGLLMLIATPVLRVAVSLAEFAREKDWSYVLITSIVLIVLLISFMLGKAG